MLFPSPQEVNRMSATIQNDIGKIIFSDDILKQMIGYAATESYGVVGMATKSAADGISGLLGRESLSKGVKISSDQENEINAELYIVVKYGMSLQTVAENIIEHVKYVIKENTSLEVNSVNVFIQGIRA